MRTFQRVLLVGAFLNLFAQYDAGAQGGDFRPRITRTAGKIGKTPGSLVTVNERPVMSFTSRGGGSARAELVAGRLRTVTIAPAPWTIDAANLPGIGWTLSVNNNLITTVTAQDAKDHNSSIPNLTKTWARALQAALSEPPIDVPSGAVVPTGETRTVMVKGAAQATDISIRVSDTDIATARFDVKSRRLVIQGKAPGRVSITLTSLSDGPVQAILPVAVENFAAAIDRDITVNITGKPVTQAMAQQAMWSALSQAISADPNANVEIPPAIKTVKSTGEYDVEVRASGSDVIPVGAHVQVALKSQQLPPMEAETLFYSNNPETITAGGELYAAPVYSGTPARLDFHHQNIGAKMLGFQVSLMNRSDSPLSVQVISGVATPAVDTIQVGRRAGAEFMKAMDGDAGIIVNVPAYSLVPIITQKLPPAYTVSGIVQLRHVAGSSPVIVRVNADEGNSWIGSGFWNACEKAVGNAWRLTPILPLPANHNNIALTNTSQIFPQPHIARDVSYSVGGAWQYIEMGRSDALRSIDGKVKLDGNYGVDYDIDLHLSNTTDTAKNIGIFFAPEAGPAAGVFQIDNGEYLEYNPTKVEDQPLLAKLPLAPGEHRDVHIRTIPLNGGFYPAAVIVHQL